MQPAEAKCTPFCGILVSVPHVVKVDDLVLFIKLDYDKAPLYFLGSEPMYRVLLFLLVCYTIGVICRRNHMVGDA